MKVCKTKDCSNTNIIGWGYCNKHYQQFKLHGETFRSVYDRNKIIKKGKIAFIELYDRQGNITAKAIIDSEDIEKVKQFKWHAKKMVSMSNKYYVYYNITRCKCTGLHNVITGKKGIDHINRNPLDNRKYNLRIATASQQNMNKDRQNNNKSGYTGVFYHYRKIDGKYYGYWEGWIIKNKKRIYLGQSKNKEKIIKLRKEAEIKYFGEYRNVNQTL